MPQNYTKDTKLDALELLTMHKSVTTVHLLTGIPKRTLRRWRQQLRDKYKLNPLTEKNIPSVTKRSQIPQNGHITDQSGHITDENGHKSPSPMLWGGVGEGSIDENGQKSPLPVKRGGREEGSIDQPERIRDAVFDNSVDPSRSNSTLGIPGKTYPYPLEEDELTNGDQYEDFKDLRDKLMQHAKILADQLITTDENVNLRSLAFSRILDRILQLDNIIPDKNPEQIIRIEYVYNGKVHNVPPWRDTKPYDPTSNP